MLQYRKLDKEGVYMFAFWYWSFGCIALFLLFLAWWATVYKKSVDEHKKSRFYWNKYIDSGRSDEDHYDKYREHKKKYYEYEERTAVPFVGGIIFGFALFIFLLISIIAPISARHELISFEETRTVYSQSLREGSDYENATMTAKVIDANSWLAKARSSVRMFGNYSKYSTIDLDSVEPISLCKESD